MSSLQSPYGAVIVIARGQLCLPCSLDVLSSSPMSVTFPLESIVNFTVTTLPGGGLVWLSIRIRSHWIWIASIILWR